MIKKSDTICAPATPAGGALSVIRISGPESLAICETIFFPADKSLIVSEQSGFKIIYGEIREEEEIIDDVLLSIFRAPHSYTGEDSAEISCHGSRYILARYFELLMKRGLGCSSGEYIDILHSAKMDLSQAEAVADLVASGSRAAHRIAVNQMRGGFSLKLPA